MEGYVRGAIRIDLTSGKIEKNQLSEEFCHNWIGGYGFITKILWDECPAGCDPLGPDNPFIVATGPFPGTIIPTSSKYCVGAKSPLTRRIGFGISSGSIGAQMARAGINLLILKGKAPEPSFIFVDDDNIQIIPCKNTLWDKDAWTIEDEIRAMFSDPRIAVMATGQAGQRMGYMACITNDRNRQVGRTGMGAVMGSKNICAIAFRGTKPITVAKPKEFMTKAKELIKIANGKETIKYRDIGTPVNVMAFNEIGCLPTKNFQTGFWEKADVISGETMKEKWVVRKAACSQCPIACDHLCSTDGVSGKAHPKWPGVVSSVDYESIYSLGSVCLVDDFPAIIKAIELCDRYCIDTMSGGVTVGYAMEAYEKGFLTKKMLGDNPVYKNGLRWGDGEAMVQMVEDICLQTTEAGKILAKGTREAAKIFGKNEKGNAMDFSMEVKGLAIPGYELKALSTAAAGFAVSLRGCCHLRNGSYSMDIKKKYNRNAWDKEDERAKDLYKGDLEMALIDCYIVCKFTRGIYKNVQEQAEVYEMVTGLKTDDKFFYKRAAAIINVGKLFNIRECLIEGVDPVKEDELPERCYNEPNLDGPTKGWKIDREGHMRLVKAYYKAHGWDERGYPRKSKLAELGITDYAEKIKGATWSD